MGGALGSIASNAVASSTAGQVASTVAGAQGAGGGALFAELVKQLSGDGGTATPGTTPALDAPPSRQPVTLPRRQVAVPPSEPADASRRTTPTIPFAEAVRDVSRPELREALADPVPLKSPFAEAVGFLDLPRPPSAAPETAPAPTRRRQPKITPPDGPSPVENTLPSTTSRRPPSADPERIRELIDTLQEEGVERLPAIGLAGNIFQESSFDHTAVGDNGKSVGIAQFNGPRAEALFRFARVRGENVPEVTAQTDFRTIPREQFPSFSTQARFIAEELRTTEAKAAERLRTARSPEQAAAIASASFFRPGDPRLENRVNAATRFAREFGLDPAPSPVDAALRKARAGDFSALDALPVEQRLSALRKLGASLGAPNPR